ncbi:hypothetical protein [Actibacterium sp. 188UL27-1]|uniref:hypothetical protein n=1 Tax=Actibacterium sp. 188UL27-1 TaxID=2786961 RepID=UPI001956ED9C|nr:hypothetical protein [Actibacterium sp. 188UL27-1]MBM7069148.1 hypothetical protein [Actibacterium sp. 188UL27-1]
MPTKRRATLAAGLITIAAASSLHAAAQGERVTIKGEVIDTWCYFSGVMGSADAVVGSAHHTCALWCSAGGIPVGLLAEDGTVYMVLKIDGDDTSNGGDTQLQIASHTITADGMLYQRDGINYIVVSQVVADDDIINATHDDYGVIPGFAIPKSAKE